MASHAQLLCVRYLHTRNLSCVCTMIHHTAAGSKQMFLYFLSRRRHTHTHNHAFSDSEHTHATPPVRDACRVVCDSVGESSLSAFKVRLCSPHRELPSSTIRNVTSPYGATSHVADNGCAVGSIMHGADSRASSKAYNVVTKHYPCALCSPVQPCAAECAGKRSGGTGSGMKGSTQHIRSPWAPLSIP